MTTTNEETLFFIAQNPDYSITAMDVESKAIVDGCFENIQKIKYFKKGLKLTPFGTVASVKFLGLEGVLMIITGDHRGKINPHSLLRSFWNLMMEEPGYGPLAQQKLSNVCDFVRDKLKSTGMKDFMQGFIEIKGREISRPSDLKIIIEDGPGLHDIQGTYVHPMAALFIAEFSSNKLKARIFASALKGEEPSIIESLKAEITEVRAENTELRTENTEVRTENTTLRVENTEVRAENTKLTYDMSRIEEFFKSQTAQINAQFQTVIGNAQKVAEEQKAIAEESKTLAEEQKAIAEASQATVGQISGQLTQSQATVGQIQGQLTQVQGQLKQVAVDLGCKLIGNRPNNKEHTNCLVILTFTITNKDKSVEFHLKTVTGQKGFHIQNTIIKNEKKYKSTVAFSVVNVSNSIDLYNNVMDSICELEETIRNKHIYYDYEKDRAERIDLMKQLIAVELKDTLQYGVQAKFDEIQ